MLTRPGPRKARKLHIIINLDPREIHPETDQFASAALIFGLWSIFVTIQTAQKLRVFGREKLSTKFSENTFWSGLVVPM